MKKFYFLGLLLFLSLSSCINAKRMAYFQELKRSEDITHKIDNYSPLIIQPGDELGISVRSLSPEGSAIFNSESSAASTGPDGQTKSSSGSGYLVDQKGEILFPLIHNVKVSGYTLAEVQNMLQKAVTPFLKEPIVTVHLSNFKISVLGDVGHPGVFPINEDHLSLPEALSIAGDLGISGKRENILLIREIDGKRKYVNIDITSNKLFDSPYYYLKNNDILYVEAGPGKFISISPVKTDLPLVFSVVSLILIFIQVNHNYKIF
jgi:polysaccharide biosynthesis/export protein